MSNNRPVTTDALETLGTLLDETQKRDAIHLAVEPVIAACRLRPGDHVTVVNGRAGRSPVGKGLGIVDPFLVHDIEPGDRFWFVMYPRQVHSLRHVWTHPAFPSEETGEPLDPKVVARVAKRLTLGDSEAWLRNFCAHNDCPPYDELIALAEENTDKDFIHVSGTDAHGEIPPEFWDHVEAIVGKEIPHEFRAAGFSCSC